MRCVLGDRKDPSTVLLELDDFTGRPSGRGKSSSAPGTRYFTRSPDEKPLLLFDSATLIFLLRIVRRNTRGFAHVSGRRLGKLASAECERRFECRV
jgi:hypothetical protein